MLRTGGGGLEGPGDLGDVGSGGTYGTTLKPKNSFPNGRFNAAGTLTSDSIISLVTTFCLLQEKVSGVPQRKQVRQTLCV